MQIDVRPNASSLSSTLQTEDVAAAIERMENRLAAAPHDKSLAYLRFQLAVLYAHHRNPAPNYLKASELLTEYLTLKPQQANSDEVHYLQALLKQIGRQKERTAELEYQVTANQNAADRLSDANHTLQIQLENLQQANRRLADENQHLELENQSMHEMIEQLKRLDVRTEKKRQELDQF